MIIYEFDDPCLDPSLTDNISKRKESCFEIENDTSSRKMTYVSGLQNEVSTAYFQSFKIRDTEVISPLIASITSKMKPILDYTNLTSSLMNPIFEKFIDFCKPIIDFLGALGVESEVFLSNKLDLANFEEPDNFYIISSNLDDLTLDTEEMELLLKKLKDNKFDKELADWYLNYDNDIEDLTED